MGKRIRTVAGVSIDLRPSALWTLVGYPLFGIAAYAVHLSAAELGAVHLSELDLWWFVVLFAGGYFGYCPNIPECRDVASRVGDMAEPSVFWRRRAADAIGAVCPAIGAGIITGLNGAHATVTLLVSACAAGIWMLLAPLGRRLVSPHARPHR